MAIVSSAAAGLRAATPSPLRGEGRGEGLKRISATIIQLRAPGLSTALFETEARELLASTSIPVVVSSRCDVALATGAAGVHLPESDISVAEARTLLGRQLVGRSVHSIAAAQQAEREGADYVIFGPVWESASHPGTNAAGPDALAQLVRSVGIPILAIGGVTEARVTEILNVGAAGYAAIRLFE
jgi:thiamine-phosphate pyrophosphorylase